MCVFQERLLFISSPRNFASLTVCICLSSYFICMSEMHVVLLVNWINRVLSRFREREFSLNHLFNCIKISLKSLCIWVIFGLVSIMLFLLLLLFYSTFVKNLLGILIYRFCVCNKHIPHCHYVCSCWHANISYTLCRYICGPLQANFTCLAPNDYLWSQINLKLNNSLTWLT